MHVIIPARYGSERLPGKPLLKIGGKPLLQHVYERALASGAGSIVIATDDERIRTAALAFGARVCMTSRQHRSGTERIAEVVRELGLVDSEVVVNLQGDEPLMPPALIATVAETLVAHPQAAVATARHPIDDQAALLNPNVVKVVCDADGFALYFSRAPIPWRRQPGGQARGAGVAAFRHIGIYAYRAGFISRYTAWAPCALEEIERLEQLRVLWYGARIIVCDAARALGAGVDTLEDLERVRGIIEKGES